VQSLGLPLGYAGHSDRLGISGDRYIRSIAKISDEIASGGWKALNAWSPTCPLPVSLRNLCWRPIIPWRTRPWTCGSITYTNGTVARSALMPALALSCRHSTSWFTMEQRRGQPCEVGQGQIHERLDLLDAVGPARSQHGCHPYLARGLQNVFTSVDVDHFARLQASSAGNHLIELRVETGKALHFALYDCIEMPLHLALAPLLCGRRGRRPHVPFSAQQARLVSIKSQTLQSVPDIPVHPRACKEQPHVRCQVRGRQRVNVNVVSLEFRMQPLPP